MDVEEWYHNCCIEEYVRPERRPPLLDELDRLLPELLDLIEQLPARATLFVLGEVAERVPARIREARDRGHEIACHGYLHLRANDRSAGEFRRDLQRAKGLLEDLTGDPVRGFRAPEWSLRSPANPRLRIVAECGFDYDSSLVAAIGSGSSENPEGLTRFLWPDGLTLLELPPLVWAGPLRLPAGGWCGRLAHPRWLRGALEVAREGRGSPIVVVHPWEVVDRAVPGVLTGLGRFFHEAARKGYRERFVETYADLGFSTLAELYATCLRRLSAEPVAAAPATGPQIFAPAAARR
ncbi:MAG: polysaccharide deacetylase family protein [Acidobacteria bacterium]|nr:polysaccharide deacetylase family protein [Acidobacteriota bacterium]